MIEHTKKQKKQLTISSQIQRVMVLSMVISLLVVGLISIVMNFVTTVKNLKNSMALLATESGAHINSALKAEMKQVELLGNMAELGTDQVSIEKKTTILKTYQEHYGWLSANILDTEGYPLGSTAYNFADKEFFKAAINGVTTASDPVYEESLGTMMINFAAPLWKDGVYDSEIVGIVLVTEDAAAFSDMMADIQISDNAGAYMINSDGVVIASDDYDSVLKAENSIEDAKTNSDLKSLAALEKKMIAGESGSGSYSYRGQSEVMAYSPIGINGWSIAVYAPYMDFLTGTIVGIVVTILLMIVAISVAIYFAKKIGNKIGEPIKLCAERIRLLGEGDLVTPVPEIKTEDETKVLADATTDIVTAQSAIIGDLSYILEEMAGGNFAIRSRIGKEAYVGSYVNLITSANELVVKMSDTLKSIKQGSDEVSMGASQLAEGSQNLAEGSTDQAGSVEELQATIMDVTERVGENAKETEAAAIVAVEVADKAQASRQEMDNMTKAMEQISATSLQIENIIGEIEDIAGQTNLLSLNAAIEAARAGEAGRGFAVVADQIRKLAEDSAASAVNTKNLIESAISEIKNGNEIAERTANAMRDVIEGLQAIAHRADVVSKNSAQQADMMEQLEKGVDQIAEVVKGNSAIAQEVSATSEELSAQAISLDNLVNQFTLRD